MTWPTFSSRTCSLPSSCHREQVWCMLWIEELVVLIRSRPRPKVSRSWRLSPRWQCPFLGTHIAPMTHHCATRSYSTSRDLFPVLAELGYAVRHIRTQEHTAPELAKRVETAKGVFSRSIKRKLIHWMRRAMEKLGIEPRTFST